SLPLREGLEEIDRRPEGRPSPRRGRGGGIRRGRCRGRAAALREPGDEEDGPGRGGGRWRRVPTHWPVNLSRPAAPTRNGRSVTPSRGYNRTGGPDAWTHDS